MSRITKSPITIFAREYGVSRQKVVRLGLDRLLAMSDEARMTLLSCRRLGITNRELHKGGLSARGFRVRGKSV